MTPNKNIEEQWEKEFDEVWMKSAPGEPCPDKIELVECVRKALDQQRQEIIKELEGMRNTILIEAFDVNEKYTHGWQNCVDQAISKIKEL